MLVIRVRVLGKRLEVKFLEKKIFRKKVWEFLEGQRGILWVMVITQI